MRVSKIKIKKGDRVKVIDQNIFGTVLVIHKDTNEIVIQDDASEYEGPDNELVYRKEELNLLVNKDQVEYWLGTDFSLDDAMEMIMELVNGEYDIDQMKVDILILQESGDE